MFPRTLLRLLTLILIASGQLSSILAAQSTQGKALAKSTVAGGHSADDQMGLSVDIPHEVDLPAINDLFTGTLSYRIPLDIPDAINPRLTPKVQLTYTSSDKRSWAGLGWDLQAGSIERDVTFGIDYSGKDFVLRLEGRRIPMVSVAGTNEFRPKLDDEALTMRVIQQSGNQFWEVSDKFGITYRFGYQPSSRMSDPAHPDKVFAWLLDSTSDLYHNTVRYSYDAVTDPGTNYLKTITYTENGAIPADYEIAIDLAVWPNLPTFIGDYPKNIGHVIDTIRIRMKGKDVKRYKCQYRSTSFTNQPILIKVALQNGDGTVEQGSYSLTYYDGNGHRTSEPWGQLGVLPRNAQLVGLNCLMGDFDGDGRKDVACQSGGNWSVGLSRAGSGGGKWNVTQFSNGPMPKGFLGNECLLGDFDGDGKTDVACYMNDARHPDFWHVALSTGSSFQVGCPTKCWGNGPAPGAYVQEHCVAGDFNGDGKTDIACVSAISGTYRKWDISFSSGAGFFKPITVEGPNAGFLLSQACFAADFDGDGAADIACSAGGSFQVGMFHWNKFELYSWAFDPPSAIVVDPSQECVIGDFNGDGRSDIACYVVTAPLKRTWQIFFGMRSNLVAQNWGPTPQAAQCTTGHHLGSRSSTIACNGAAGLFIGVATSKGWQTLSSDDSHTGFTRSPSCFIGDIDGDDRPDQICYGASGWQVASTAAEPTDLLLVGTTPLGAKIEVRYSRSTAYPNKRLPFNVDVVSGLGISLGGGTDRQTTYSYAGGYFDVVGREFKGFASVTAVEQDASRSGPLRKQYTYDQGLKGELSSGEKWGLTGKLLRAETRDATGWLFVDVYKYRLPEDVPPFHTSLELTTHWICSNRATVCPDSSTPFVQTLYQYDDLVNVIQERRHDSLVPSWDKLTKRLFVSSDPKLGGMPLFEDVFQAFATQDLLLRRTRYDYDSVDSDCKDIAEPTLTRGSLTKIMRWVEGDRFSTERRGYNPRGKLLCLQQANGGVTRLAYDPSNTFVLEIHDALNHARTIDYYGLNGRSDESIWFGLPKSLSGMNGTTTLYSYDMHRRVASIRLPNYLLITREYHSIGDPTQQSVTETYDKLPIVRSFNGAGWIYRTVQPALHNKVRIVEQAFDSYHKLVKDVRPYFQGEMQYARQLQRDALGRLIKSTELNGSTNLFCRDGVTVIHVDSNQHISRLSFTASGKNSAFDTFGGTSKGCPSTPGTRLSHQGIGFDALERVSSVQGSKTVSYNYSGLNVISSEENTLTGRWTFDYDLEGNLIGERHYNESTKYTYDLLGRLKTITPTHGLPYELTYDEGENGVGRLSSVFSMGKTKWTYEYARTYLRRVTRTTGKPEYSIGITRDLFGRVSEITYPQLGAVSYVYDAFQKIGLNYKSKPILSISETTAAGQPLASQVGPLQLKYKYCEPSNIECPEPTFRLQSIEAFKASSSLLSTKYKYDPKGNVKADISPAQSLYYDFDVHDELKKVSGGKTVLDVSYEDGDGNIQSRSDVGAYTYEKQRPTALKSAGSYANTIDEMGRTSIASKYHIEHDDAGRPTEISWEQHSGGKWWPLFPKEKRVSFSYGFAGALETECYSRVLPYPFVWIVGDKCIAHIGPEVEIAGSKVTAHLRGFWGPAASVTQKRNAFYGTDLTRSVRLVLDQKSGKASFVNYTPFGAPILNKGQSFNLRFAFAGAMNVRDTGLSLVGPRLYDPHIGRFLEPDGAPPQSFDQLAWNSYAYASNNPVTNADFSGFDSHNLNRLSDEGGDDEGPGDDSNGDKDSGTKDHDNPEEGGSTPDTTSSMNKDDPADTMSSRVRFDPDWLWPSGGNSLSEVSNRPFCSCRLEAGPMMSFAPTRIPSIPFSREIIPESSSSNTHLPSHHESWAGVTADYWLSYVTPHRNDSGATTALKVGATVVFSIPFGLAIIYANGIDEIIELPERYSLFIENSEESRKAGEKMIQEIK